MIAHRRTPLSGPEAEGVVVDGPFMPIASFVSRGCLAHGTQVGSPVLVGKRSWQTRLRQRALRRAHAGALPPSLSAAQERLLRADLAVRPAERPASRPAGPRASPGGADGGDPLRRDAAPFAAAPSPGEENGARTGPASAWRIADQAAHRLVVIGERRNASGGVRRCRCPRPIAIAASGGRSGRDGIHGHRFLPNQRPRANYGQPAADAVRRGGRSSSHRAPACTRCGGDSHAWHTAASQARVAAPGPTAGIIRVV